MLAQGADNLEAADAASLNSLAIDWLRECVHMAAAAAARSSSGASADSAESVGGATGAAPDVGGAADGQDGQAQEGVLLRQQLLALLRLSGSYSISGERRFRAGSGPALFAVFAVTSSASSVQAGTRQRKRTIPPAWLACLARMGASCWHGGGPPCGPIALLTLLSFAAARDLRLLLQLLRPGSSGEPPTCTADLLEVRLPYSQLWLQEHHCIECIG